MNVLKSLDSRELVEALKNGSVAVIPTDTIYGVVGLATSKEAVDRIYQLKGRAKSKQSIVLISSLDDLKLLGVEVDENTKKLIEKYWPGKVSIVFQRKSDSLAARQPDFPELRDLIKKTGPLVAPSANPEGQPPAENVQEAIDYFGDKVDYYVDGGELDSPPSTLIKIEGGKVVVLRKGAVKINQRDISAP